MSSVSFLIYVSKCITSKCIANQLQNPDVWKLSHKSTTGTFYFRKFMQLLQELIVSIVGQSHRREWSKNMCNRG